MLVVNTSREQGEFMTFDAKFYQTVPPNVKYADEFVKLQQEARENNRGLWGLDNRE